MPRYVYSNADRSQYKEIVLGMREEKPASIMVDGEEFRRDIAMEHTGPPLKCSLWPMPPCFAVGVLEHQVPDMREKCKRFGVGDTEFVNGDPVFRDQAHMNRFNKAFGYVDLN